MSEEKIDAPKEPSSSSPKPKRAPKKPSDPLKITRGTKKKIDLSLKKIKGIVGHIRNVQDNCLALGERLIERGEIDLGKNLIANGCIHDVSKFHGIEFEYMAPGISIDEDVAKLKLKLAIHHHRTINPHHVEYWSKGIEEMPRVYLAELICDLKARSEEFGTDLRKYIDEMCNTKWNISKTHRVYLDITDFVNLLCPIPFKEIK
jgi:hypothetical protein